MLKSRHPKKWRGLLEYLDGRLSPKSSGQLEGHLARCSLRREAYEELQVTREALRVLKAAVEQDSPLPTWSAIETRLGSEGRLRSRSLPGHLLLRPRLRRLGRSISRAH